MADDKATEPAATPPDDAGDDGTSRYVIVGAVRRVQTLARRYAQLPRDPVAPKAPPTPPANMHIGARPMSVRRRGRPSRDMSNFP